MHIIDIIGTYVIGRTSEKKERKYYVKTKNVLLKV